MTSQDKKLVVYVAMSGGVDSSVAAALLKKKGYSVIGVFMKQWQPDKGEVRCLWQEEREYALRAAAQLDMPLLTWDFTKEYKKYVADYMIREYRAGRTPNPDVMCNKEIKFGLFFKHAVKEGADYIATGHYARIVVSGKEASYILKTGHDKNKDQSYFLWTLTQKQLSKTLFPIGDLTKPQVRILAKKFKLPNYDKKDSQGVCFIGELNMHDFLKEYIKPKKGKIISLDNQALGQHDGVYYYTIGQRHGLNITHGGGPYYVVRKDIEKNIIYVGTEKDLASKNIHVNELHWIGPKPKLPAEISVRIRYRAPLKKGVISKDGLIKLNDLERGETSGQSAVFYKDGIVLGGGIIS